MQITLSRQSDSFAISHKRLQNERLVRFTGIGATHAKRWITMNPILIAKTSCQSPTKPVGRVAAIIAGAALLILAGATTSCSTTRGFGQDVEKTGDKIQRAASN